MFLFKVNLIGQIDRVHCQCVSNFVSNYNIHNRIDTIKKWF